MADQANQPQSPSLWDILKTKVAKPELGEADMDLARKREGK